jgi:hypothetical protein
MANKKITDLNLRSDFDETCLIPVDDAVQTWRTSGEQILDFILGNLVEAVTSKTTTYLATLADTVILCSGSAFTVTLPAASNRGKKFYIKKTDSSYSNIITIAVQGGDDIDGASTTTVNTKDEAIELIADGSTSYKIISRTYPCSEVSWTPTLGAGFGTTSNLVASYRRVPGGYIRGRLSFTNGTVAASVASFTLDTGLTLDTTRLTISNNNTSNPGDAVGQWKHNSFSNENGYVVTAPSTSTSTIYFGTSTTSSGMLVSQTGAAIVSSAGVIHVEFEVPISGWK